MFTQPNPPQVFSIGSTRLSNRKELAHPINRFTAAVTNSYPHKAASHSLCKKGHVAPALQLVSGQADPVELFWEGNRLRLWESLLFPVGRTPIINLSVKAVPHWAKLLTKKALVQEFLEFLTQSQIISLIEATMQEKMHKPENHFASCAKK